MDKPADSYFEVHVFGGPRDGEGIVLRFPDGSFAVIDSCVSKDSNGDTEYPILRFLNDRNVKKLRFVCLTHPHADHYRGLVKILRSLEVQEFWQSQALTFSQLKSIINLRRQRDLEFGDYPKGDDNDELHLLYELLKEKLEAANRQRRKNGFQFQLIGINRLLSIHSSVDVVALAPHGNEVMNLEYQLGSAFDEDGRIKSKFDQNINSISCAFLIRLPAFNVMLGGDVESRSWKLIVPAIDPAYAGRLQSSLFKVCHHGSDGAYCKELEDTFVLPDRRTDFVVTGYYPSKLPRPEMIDCLKAAAKSVSLTHRSHIRLESDLRPLNSSREALAREFGIAIPVQQSASREAISETFQVRRPAVANFGRCSFHFDGKGNLVSHDVSDPAMLV